MTQSEFKNTTAENIKKLMPIGLTVNGEIFAVVSPSDGVIVVSDLHPRVRNMLRQQELRARSGMPKPERIRLEDIEVKEPKAEEVESEG